MEVKKPCKKLKNKYITKSEKNQLDVEQTAHAFLKQQGRRKSQRKIKGGCQ